MYLSVDAIAIGSTSCYLYRVIYYTYIYAMIAKNTSHTKPSKQPRQITISDLTYSIGTTTILEKLSCAIVHHKTPVVGMIGHNGAGKTTLAKIIA